MAGARRADDLAVYQLAQEVRVRLRAITRRKAFGEHLWLRTQLRRAANSACSNTFEGFSRYRPKVFAQFLEIARGSLAEIIVHLDDVLGFELASEEEVRAIEKLADRGQRAATKLITYLKGDTNEP